MKQIEDFLIFDIPHDNEIDMEMVEKISVHTHNTWQPGRSLDEIRINTLQGKKAEFVIETYLANNSDVRYLSYDNIRKDELKKHAPFDGIVYKSNISTQILEEGIERVNNDVIAGTGDIGLITPNTRNYLENNGIYTVEIKSSLLQRPRDYRGMVHVEPETRTLNDYQKLCAHIKKFYDYFVYPKFCRNDMTISNFYEYTKKLEGIEDFSSCNNPADLLNSIVLHEFKNACVVYTRVFFDLIANEIFVPGYILKTSFFEEPRIQKMPSAKSQKALYYMYHMKYGKPIRKLGTDDELWNWNKDTQARKLLDTTKQVCPSCGNKLRLVEVKHKRKHIYVCNECPTNSKWHEMKTIHPKNM